MSFYTHYLYNIHRSGIIIKYEAFPHQGSGRRTEEQNTQDNWKLNTAKKIISNGTYYLARQHTSKKPPILPVLTLPRNFPSNISNDTIRDFWNGLRNDRTYGIHNYLWVREYTKKGRIHYHGLVDCESFPIQKATAFWSRLWGSDSKNSIRLGKEGRRRLITDKTGRCAWYLTKYLTKQQDLKKVPGAIRHWGMSKKLRKKSEPINIFDLELYDRVGFHDKSYDWVTSRGCEIGIPKGFDIKNHRYSGIFRGD